MTNQSFILQTFCPKPLKLRHNHLIKKIDREIWIDKIFFNNQKQYISNGFIHLFEAAMKKEILVIYDENNFVVSQYSTQLFPLVSKKIPVSSVSDLFQNLDTLVSENESFKIIIFSAHGSPGQMVFDNTNLTDLNWRGVNDRYSSIAKEGAIIYFMSCNVVDGERGWDFLEAATKALMSICGGQAVGYTDYYFAPWINLNPAITTQVGFSFGNTRTVSINNNGENISRQGD